MANFVFSYPSPKGYVPGPETMAPWSARFESLGEALVDIGKPVLERSVLGKCGTEETDLRGYSFVAANDLEAAVALAKSCPMLEPGGGVEVGELTRPSWSRRRAVTELAVLGTDSEQPGSWRSSLERRRTQ